MKLLARLAGIAGAALLALGVVMAHVLAQEVKPQVAPPVFGGSPLLSPAEGITVTTPRPTFDWADATGEVVSYTLLITRTGATLAFTSTTSALTLPVDLPGSGGYFWTVQAHNSAGDSGFVSPAGSFTLDYTWQVFVPVVFKSPACPTTSANSYSLIPFAGARADRPGPQHADLNLALRGYSVTSAPQVLVQYSGSTDPNAPQLDGLFEPNNYPGISAVFRVNDWVWTGPYPDPGHVGSVISTWPVTLLELPASFGTRLYLPERPAEIYGGGYRAMVLYAESNRITLGYTRDDTIAYGYAVHLENICVDPNLLALYQAQTDAAGWHVTGQLPGLKNNQPLGTAFIGGVRVAIRDRGAFMDPRSRKDWWVNYAAGLEIQRSHDTLLK
ncbi:MAG: hypothetical protein FOGNACKC_05720 [Anaerolineae bacterium]|nr:hypothetical protein [Anaerolineae bacterium]